MEDKKVTKIQHHWGYTRNCIRGKVVEEISGCVIKKTWNRWSCNCLPGEGGRGSIYACKCWSQRQHRKGHQECDVPKCVRMRQLCTAPTTICVWIELPKPFDPRCFKCPMTSMSLTFPCITAQDFFLYSDLSERRREQPEMAGNGDCFKPLHPSSSRLIEPA